MVHNGGQIMVAKMVKMMMVFLLVFGGSLYAAGDGAGGGGGQRRTRDEVAIAAALVARGHGASASDGGGQGDDALDGRNPKKKEQTPKTVSKDKRCPFAGEGDESCQQKFSEAGLKRHQNRVHNVMAYPDVTPEEIERFKRDEEVPCRECNPIRRKVTRNGYKGFFRVQTSLRAHFGIYHPKEKHPYRCGTCSYSCKAQNILGDHFYLTGHRRSSATTGVNVDSHSGMGIGVPSSSLSNLYNVPSTLTTDDGMISDFPDADIDNGRDMGVATPSSDKVIISGGDTYAAGGGGGGHKRTRDEVAAAALVAQEYDDLMLDGGGQGDDALDGRNPKKKKQTPKAGPKDKRCPFAGQGNKGCEQMFNEVGLKVHHSKIHKVMTDPKVTPEEIKRFKRHEEVPCRECNPIRRKVTNNGLYKGFFRVQTSLRDHLNKFHSKEKHQYQCGTCTYSWKTNKGLEEHFSLTGHLPPSTKGAIGPVVAQAEMQNADSSLPSVDIVLKAALALAASKSSSSSQSSSSSHRLSSSSSSSTMPSYSASRQSSDRSALLPAPKVASVAPTSSSSSALSSDSSGYSARYPRSVPLEAPVMAGIPVQIPIGIDQDVARDGSVDAAGSEDIPDAVVPITTTPGRHVDTRFGMGGGPRTSFMCHHCRKGGLTYDDYGVFERQCDLQGHIVKHHMKKYGYQCGGCSFSCPHDDDLRDHLILTSHMTSSSAPAVRGAVSTTAVDDGGSGDSNLSMTPTSWYSASPPADRYYPSPSLLPATKGAPVTTMSSSSSALSSARIGHSATYNVSTVSATSTGTDTSGGGISPRNLLYPSDVEFDMHGIPRTPAVSGQQ